MNINDIKVLGWVPVSVELPENIEELPRFTFKSNGKENISIRVLVYSASKDFIDMGTRNLGMYLDRKTFEPIWAWTDTDMSDITHWMPLPSKPQKNV